MEKQNRTKGMWMRDGKREKDQKKRTWRKADRKTAAGLSILLTIFLLTMIGPLVSGYTFDSQRIEEQNLAPRIPILEKIGLFDGSEKVSDFYGGTKKNGYEELGLTDTYYWFGSDILGRDIFTRTWMGTGISLCIAVLAAFADTAAGAAYGMISGYMGGKADLIMQRITEVLSGIPNLIIATLLILVLKPGFLAIALSISITGWIGISRVARAKVLELKEMDFVTAARTQGAGMVRLICLEILPNMAEQLTVMILLSIPNAIFMEAFLAFIGLGIPAPYASLGTLISEGFQVFTIHPYMIAWPALVLTALMLGFHLTADGLSEQMERNRG